MSLIPSPISSLSDQELNILIHDEVFGKLAMHSRDYCSDWNATWSLIMLFTSRVKRYDDASFSAYPFYHFTDILLDIGGQGFDYELYPAAEMFLVLNAWTPRLIAEAALTTIRSLKES